MSVTTQCMIVNLQIGLWNGQRLDKSASRKVTSEANADTDAASVNKHTVPKAALAQITSAASAIRMHFYEKTLPWKDNGDRVLSRSMYMKFVEQHEQLVTAFHTAVAEFIDVRYPAAIEQAAFRMGELFKADDYPSAEALRHKFYVGLDIDAVTEAGDFRVEMDQTTLDTVRQQMTTALEQRMGRAMQDVWARLAETLGHFATKMGSDDIFRDSTVKNLEDIVALLPDLNILNDPQLEQIRQDIQATIVGYSPKDLRTSPTTRATASTEAQRIMTTMAGFMNAFGGGA